MKPSDNRDFLKEILDYNPRTGSLKWKKRTAEHIPSNRYRNIWNKRFAGKEAGRIKTDGYIQLGITYQGIRQRVLAQRVIWVWMTGEIPFIVDHVDRDPSNNRWVNLRNVDYSTNALNRDTSPESSSGVVGVYRNAYSKGWKAVISVKGKTIYLGSSLCFEEAVKLRRLGELKYRNNAEPIQ